MYVKYTSASSITWSSCSGAGSGSGTGSCSAACSGSAF